MIVTVGSDVSAEAQKMAVSAEAAAIDLIWSEVEVICSEGLFAVREV